MKNDSLKYASAKNQVALDLEAAVEAVSAKVMADGKYNCLVLLYVTPVSGEVEIVRVVGCGIESFSGGKRRFLLDLVESVVTKTDRPHIHNIKDSALANSLHRTAGFPTPHRMLFYPFESGNSHYILLGILDPSSKQKYSDPLESVSFREMLALFHYSHEVARLGPQLTLTELFVKEIGHDVAAQIQTIMSKLYMITSKRVKGETAIKKAQEAEQEVLAISRISEFLGTAVDRNYQLREKNEFDLVEAVYTVIDQLESEALERNINIRNETRTKSIPFWGDRRAIEIALGQILLNSIKYGLGNSYITVKLLDLGEGYLIEVVGKSIIPLPEDLPKIFEFGWRTPEAKELHVNGSGIGLYTVKKILHAHLGDCVAESSGNGNIVTFKMCLPTMRQIKERLFELEY